MKYPKVLFILIVLISYDPVVYCQSNIPSALIYGRVTNRDNEELNAIVRVYQELPFDSGNYHYIRGDGAPGGDYRIRIDTLLTGVESNVDIYPATFSIIGYPNPFNPSAVIRIELGLPGSYSLTIYQIDGQKITGTGSSYRSRGYYEFRAANLGAGGIKIAVLDGVTNSGITIRKVFKLVQLDGSTGTPSIEQVSHGSANCVQHKAKNELTNKIRLKISFEYSGLDLPGYRDTSIIKTYTETEIYDFIPVVMQKIHGEIIEELAFTVSGTDGSSTSEEFENPKANIKIQLKNKMTNEVFTSVSDQNGKVIFYDIDILYPEFIMTFSDIENTDEAYLDKFRIRTIGKYELDNGKTVELVKNIESSDWYNGGKHYDIKDPEKFWLPGNIGAEIKSTGNELRQITFNAGTLNEIQKQGKQLEIFLIENSYLSFWQSKFPSGSVRLSDQDLHTFYNSPFNNRFDREKVLYWLLSSVNQADEDSISVELKHNMEIVSNDVRACLTHSSLGVPYLHIEEKWYDYVTKNEISETESNQISYTFAANSLGNIMNTKDGFTWRSSTYFSEDAEVERIAGLKIMEIAQMITDMHFGSYIDEYRPDYPSSMYKFSPAGIALIKYAYILELGENKIPR